MDPDPPSTSPFRAPPDGSPFRLEPEQPRLGILHLLVWTACVAVYFSITRVLYPTEFAQQDVGSGALWVGYGIGSGTALGGLLLFAARRYRGLPFPTQPGETLLVLLGVGAVLGLAQSLLLSLALDPESGIGGGMPWFSVAALQLLAMAALGVLYLVATVRTKILRWRCYFLTVVLAYALAFLLAWTGVLTWSSGRWMTVVGQAARLLPCLVLATVVTRDLFQRLRYRWTHWLGVGLALWNGGMLIVWLIWWILFSAVPF